MPNSGGGPRRPWWRRRRGRQTRCSGLQFLRLGRRGRRGGAPGPPCGPSTAPEVRGDGEVATVGFGGEGAEKEKGEEKGGVERVAAAARLSSGGVARVSRGSGDLRGEGSG